MAAVTCEMIEEKYTSIIYNLYDLKNILNFKIPNIILKQQPEEKIDIDLTITPCYRGSLHYNTSICSCKYKLILKFKNPLHFLSRNYHYKVQCYLARSNDISKNDDFLFSAECIRETSSISFSGNLSRHSNYDNSGLNYNKICFKIYRRINRENGTYEQSSINFFNSLFTNENFGNYQIKVQDKIFYVDKEILSKRSDYFKAMFSKHTSESKKGISKFKTYESEIIEPKEMQSEILEQKNMQSEIEILEPKEIEPEVIEEVLNYIYTNRTKHLNKYSKEVFRMADIFQMKDLKDKCLELIMFDLNAENFVSTLKFANYYRLDDLKEGIFKYIASNEEQFVKRKDFKDYMLTHLSLGNLAYFLELYAKFPDKLKKLKLNIFQYIKKNMNKTLYPQFLELFKTHPELMQDVWIHIST